MKKEYQYKTTGNCRAESVVQGKDWRFTVLTPALIRMEYNADGIFENRATQVVVNRDFDTPEFTVIEKDGSITIKTECLELTYCGGEFSKNSLSAILGGKNGTSFQPWHFGMDADNLKGTARTLDGADGACPLEDGIMSRRGIVSLDDSHSLILTDDGWIEPRNEATDVYLFAYKTNHLDALRDYYKLTGNPPMIPRYALGNWWSRYYKYTQQEYENLMLKFKEKDLPFSVAVIDMDWHTTKIPPECGSGWTGFTWDDELFPDHKAFLDFLHNEGMEVTLNLHPAEGIAKHEKAYEAIATRMGVDVKNGERVAFDATNPDFLEAYFEEVLNPMEEEGVSFWWMDWQQGNTTRIKGLDPLWMLNHYHYLDMKKTGKRAMIFSRYSGAGSHRYPIGFSGDTLCTWGSLEFQPYFTANASNIGYNWWSHDIGGHIYGDRNDERVTRWVQFGVFSPIMRLHSTNNDFQSKEVWLYNKEAESAMSDFLRLRHRLIPYLYTMNYRAYKEGLPLMLPLYYYSTDDLAYEYNQNEYWFGSEMIVAPITSPMSEVTLRGSVNVYLPDGMWFDLFTSHSYKGGRHIMHRNIDTIPVLVKAGGIIPMAVTESVNDISNPKTLNVVIFPGADNTFEMYEEDGCTNEYENGACVVTKMQLEWGKKFTVSKPDGDESLFVKDRRYIMEFRKIEDCDITVTEDGKEKIFKKHYRNGSMFVETENVNGEIAVQFNDEVKISGNDYKSEIFDLLLKAQYSYDMKEKIYRLLDEHSIEKFAMEIMAMDIDDDLRSALLEIAFSSYSIGLTI